MKKKKSSQVKKRKLLGVEIGQFKKNELWSLLEKNLQEKKEKGSDSKEKRGIFLVTLNPEIILKAYQDPAYLKIINSANIKINDGIGIKLGAFMKRLRCGERITGVEVANFLLEKAVKLNLKITLIFSQAGLSQKEEIENYLAQKGVGEFEVLGVFFQDNPQNNWKAILKKISKETDIVLVGLGAPWQEKFIFQLKKENCRFAVAVGVGGTFDFWTQKQCRAPLFLRKIGLEWFWRFLMQPRQRIKRIWNATVVFLWRVAFENESLS